MSAQSFERPGTDHPAYRAIIKHMVSCPRCTKLVKCSTLDALVKTWNGIYDGKEVQP